MVYWESARYDVVGHCIGVLRQQFVHSGWSGKSDEWELGLGLKTVLVALGSGGHRCRKRKGKSTVLERRENLTKLAGLKIMGR